MIGIVIHGEERDRAINDALTDYGIDSRRATQEQREEAETIARRTDEAYKDIRR